RAALSEPAAELRAVQLEIVAQHVEQRRVGLDLHRPALAVHTQREARHGVLLTTQMGPLGATGILPPRSPRCAGARAFLISSMAYTLATGTAGSAPVTIWRPRSA